MITEIESKWTISRAGFDQLLLHCDVVSCTEQLNIYFDHCWALAGVGATCRFRLAPREAAVFTLKVPVTWRNDSTRESVEIEMPATSAFNHRFSTLVRAFEHEQLARSIRDQLERLHVHRLQRVGWIRNTRRVLRLSSGEAFELDAFRLPGGERCYEVEIEEENEGRRSVLIAAVRSLVPTASPSRVSKSQRLAEVRRGEQL